MSITVSVRGGAFGKNNITWLVYFLQSGTNKNKYIGLPFSDFVVRLVIHTFTIILRVGLPHVRPGVRF
jgi:hypothetical protein